MIRRVVDGDLDQAQQRPIAALGHELRIDAEPAALPRQPGGLRDLRGAGE